MLQNRLCRICYIDFFDSFSFNIVDQLERLQFGVDVYHWVDLDQKNDLMINEFDGFVLGPGPGHPSEYSKIYPLIEKIIKKDIPLLGICLGHQLIWNFLGLDVKKIDYPLHGVAFKAELPSWISTDKMSAEVQCYNSLGVNFDDSFSQVIEKLRGEYWQVNQVIWATKFKNVLTYQFHPESVGTSCPQIFFERWASLFL